MAIDSNSSISGVGSAGFATTIGTSGTNPAPDSGSDTLNITSADGSIAVAGTASTDTLDFSHVFQGVKAGITASSTTLAVASGDYRIIDFDTAVDDPQSMLTVGAACKITIPTGKAGNYNSQFTLTFDGNATGFNAGDQVWMGFYKNGAIATRSFAISNVYSTGSFNLSCSSPVFLFHNLVATDYIQAMCRPITTSRTIITSTTFCSSWEFWRVGS